jgi:hypothetical protein
MQEVYENMVLTIKNSPVADKTETKFIDLMSDDADNYPDQLRLVDRGYQLPITFVNGSARFSGKIDEQKLIEYIEQAAKV